MNIIRKNAFKKFEINIVTNQKHKHANLRKDIDWKNNYIGS